MILKQIVTTDPDSRGYAGMTNSQVATDINEKRYSKRVRVSFVVFNQSLLDEGVTLAVIQAKLDTASPANLVANIVDSILDKAISGGISSIDMDKQSNDDLFNLMESVGLMNATQRATLEALADDFESLSDQNNSGVVMPGDVQAARA